MASELDITPAKETSMENWDETVFTPKNVDGISDQKETEWINSKWTTYWGAFNANPELKSAILLRLFGMLGKDIQQKTLIQR